jgi:DNA polymerase-3 subunit delta
MLYIIFGTDNFQVKEKLNQIIEKYKTQTGDDLNIEKFDETATISQVRNSIQLSGFFNPNKLIIFKDFINKSKIEIQREFVKLLKNLSKNVYIVFVETKSKKGNSIWKMVQENGKIWQFEPLSIYELNNWVKKRVIEKGGEIDPEAVKTLTFFISSDLWRLDLEIDKLISYKGKNIISAKDVEDLVKPVISPGIFDLIDALASKNLKSTQTILQNLLEAGENPLYIETMIVYQFRNLILVKYLSDKGAGLSEIKSQTGLHPFVIQKTSNQIKNFSLENLKKIYSKLMDAEIAMKTGKIEPDFALELLVAGLIG